MSDKIKTEYVVLRETSIESIFSDCVSFGFALAIIGISKWIDNTVFQIIGGFLFLSGLIAQGEKISKNGRYKTAQGAIDFIKTQQEQPND